MIRQTKTREGSRKIRFYAVTPDLKAYLNQHPQRGNPNAGLFYTYRKGKKCLNDNLRHRHGY
ncbi:hypothetical protein KEJ39_04260 [Candidatus Bathyarchaeota archaeon]|nr:hypothetical protein [Candidatus Bathyarchaeota archaeon]